MDGRRNGEYQPTGGRQARGWRRGTPPPSPPPSYSSPSSAPPPPPPRSVSCAGRSAGSTRRSEPCVYWEDIPHRSNRRGEAWGQYYQRMREKNEDQRERVNSRRDEWYQDAVSFYANQRTHFRSMPREAMGYTMSQHYSVLGLDRSRLELFSDAEIKNAFRRKAYHPDQNQHNKEVAEAKSKEVMDSYKAIKLERQNGSL